MVIPRRPMVIFPRMGAPAAEAKGKRPRGRPAIEPLEPREFLSASPNGLTGTYYNSMTLTKPILTRVNPQIDYYWGTNSPAASVPATHFSVQWAGQVLAPTTETYSFSTRSDDGVRLWVNGAEIINDWTNHSAKTDTATISLTGGVQYPIKIDYYQDVAVATCRLYWSTPSIAKEVVPSADLFSPPAATGGAAPGTPTAPAPTASTVPASPSPTTSPTLSSPPAPGSWNLAFDDEFNTLDTNTWTNGEYWWDGNAGTQAAFEPSNVSVANGILSITAQQQTTTAQNGHVKQYASGLLQSGGIQGVSNPGFSFMYGYVEMRTKIAPGQGMWSAFWMLPVSHQDNYELDAFEILGRDPATFTGHDHNWPTVGGEVDYDTGFDTTADWHTYGVDWEPNSITWYIDGQAVGTYTDTSVIPEQPMYLIMNLDVGGNWAGPLTSASPAQSTWQVDYIRVWQHPPGLT